MQFLACDMEYLINSWVGVLSFALIPSVSSTNFLKLDSNEKSHAMNILQTWLTAHILEAFKTQLSNI